MYVVTESQTSFLRKLNFGEIKAWLLENVQTQNELHLLTGHWEDPPQKKIEQDGHHQASLLYALLGGGYVNKKWTKAKKKKSPQKTTETSAPPAPKTGHKIMPGEGEVAFEILTAATVKLTTFNKHV